MVSAKSIFAGHVPFSIKFTHDKSLSGNKKFQKFTEFGEEKFRKEREKERKKKEKKEKRKREGEREKRKKERKRRENHFFTTDQNKNRINLM